MRPVKESSGLRSTRMAYVGSFLITTVLLAFLAIARPLKSNIAAGYLWTVALVLGTIVIGACTGSRRRFLKIFVVLAILNIVLVPPEIYLRLTGFRYETDVQFGYPRPYQLSAAERDENLFWTFPKLRPGINSYGFEGTEPARPKPAGVYRILYLGNTCTAEGFPAMTELILRETNPAVECVNFAAPGYSSYQGKVLARTCLTELTPDLLVVSFGWNDRWLAYGASDESKKMTVKRSAAAEFMNTLYNRWRLLQLFRRALSPVLGNPTPLEVSRVPADQFRKNLEEIASDAGKLGIPVIFATEPSSHPSIGVPDDVVTSGFAKSKETSLALFREYNDVVRDVAREQGSGHLIDLDALMSSRSDVRQLFMGDGIRYSRPGMAVVADIEARFIAEHVLSNHGK